MGVENGEQKIVHCKRRLHGDQYDNDEHTQEAESVKVRVDDGRTYSVPAPWAPLVKSVCKNSTRGACEAFANLPDVKDVGNPLLVALRCRLQPEFRALVKRSMLKWTPKAQPEKSEALVSKIGDTLPKLLEDLRRLCPTLLEVVEMVTNSQYDPAALASRRSYALPSTIDLEGYDSSEDSDFVLDEGDSAAESDFTDDSAFSGSDDERDGGGCSDQDEDKVDAEAAKTKLREEKADLAQLKQLMHPKNDQRRRENKLTYTTGLLLFQRVECLSLVAAHAGLHLSCGGLKVGPRGFLNYLGLATSVSTSDRHRRNFAKDSMLDARLAKTEVEQHELAKVAVTV
jgi:hypothetical protein